MRAAELLHFLGSELEELSSLAEFTVVKVLLGSMSTLKISSLGF